MPNVAFGLNPANFAKTFIDQNAKREWTKPEQVVAYQVAAMGQLPTDEACDEMNRLLGKVNMVLVASKVINSKSEKTTALVETFGLKGIKLDTAPSRKDMELAIAAAMWGEEKAAEKVKRGVFKIMDAEEITDLYRIHADKPDKTKPFFLYRIRIGEHIIYRITNDAQPAEGLVAEGVRYIIKYRDGKEDGLDFE